MLVGLHLLRKRSNFSYSLIFSRRAPARTSDRSYTPDRLQLLVAHLAKILPGHLFRQVAAAGRDPAIPYKNFSAPIDFCFLVCYKRTTSYDQPETSNCYGRACGTLIFFRCMGTGPAAAAIEKRVKAVQLYFLVYNGSNFFSARLCTN